MNNSETVINSEHLLTHTHDLGVTSLACYLMLMLAIEPQTETQIAALLKLSNRQAHLALQRLVIYRLIVKTSADDGCHWYRLLDVNEERNP